MTRLWKAKLVADTEWQAELPDAEIDLAGRMSRADLWEVGADERERLADERDRLADERDALADEREVLSDRNDQVLDRREGERRARAAAIGAADDADEVADAQAALRRAEAAVRRAEAELVRAREAAGRVAARAELRADAADRMVAAQVVTETAEHEELAWLADRRDFIAAERDGRAAERDKIADLRDETGLQRERFADDREREALERERDLDQARRPGQVVNAVLDSAVEKPSIYAERQTSDRQRRARAAAGRRAAAQVRAHAATRWGPQAYGPMLVASFAQVAKQLFDSEDLTESLPQVLKFTVGAVAGCDWASITRWRHGRFSESVTGDAVAAGLDDIQFGSGLGPGPDALQSEDPVYAPHLAESTRWPVLASTAAQLGVGSALCHGLFVHRAGQWSALGTFNLYSASSDAFSEEDQEFSSILAAYVSVAVDMGYRRDDVDRREAALHRGLSTRDVIGQAKGILMERQRLCAGDAFDLLRRASQRLNLKLVDVAQHLADTGELPK